MDSSTQQKMTLVACRLLIICTWATTFTRPLVVDLNVAFTLIGIVEGIIALLLYAAVRAELLGRSAPVLVSLALPLMCLPLILISGGVNSPITYLLPIFPFYATLMMGARFSWAATAIICLGMVPMGIYAESIVDTTDTPFSKQVIYARTYWIVAALAAGAIVSTYFNGLSESLSKTLRDEANMDFLTRVTNNSGLEKILEREANTARRHDSWLSLILVNVDNFKDFNNALGHATADECLIQVAESLSGVLRTKQDYLGRWAGDEFVLILPDTNPDEARSIAELARGEIEFMKNRWNLGSGNITATLGSCSAKGSDTRIRKMLASASRAMQTGKTQGKNRVVASLI